MTELLFWLKALSGPFLEMLQRLTTASDDEERLEATVRFQREASDVIARRAFGIPEPPVTRP